MSSRSKIIPVAVALVITSLMLIPLHADQKLMGRFPDIGKLDSFERHVTTADEIIAALGLPAGNGASILPPDYQRRDIFYYEAINIGEMTSERTGSGTDTYIEIDMEQNILGILLLDGKFDGFMWYSNSGLIEGLTK
jgi:hypothetical protein